VSGAGRVESYFSSKTRALINAETNQVVNGSGTAPNMTGILNVSGMLTRAMGTDTPLDAIQLAFNGLRVGPAFATADLVAMHPTTWNAIRRQKTTFDSYILSPDPSTGQVESLWGVTVVVNTFIPAGTAIVFYPTQAVLAWTRLGLTMGVNQFGDTEWTNNLVSFRVEERVAIGVRRPTAVCTVTGLPTSVRPDDESQSRTTSSSRPRRHPLHHRRCRRRAR
jgi:HK97 family phage major capsid protein